MPKNITIIDGHPDPSPERFCHALTKTYSDGCDAGGHKARLVNLSALEFPLLKSAADWEKGPVPPGLKEAQEAIAWADHLVFVYPLWLGAMPALLKAFLEQSFRPGFAIKAGARTLRPGLLTGKSARIIITMGMPGFFYRWYFGAHSLKRFERNILRFAGIGPIKETLIGCVASGDEASHRKWLDRMQALGREAR